VQKDHLKEGPQGLEVFLSEQQEFSKFCGWPRFEPRRWDDSNRKQY